MEFKYMPTWQPYQQNQDASNAFASAQANLWDPFLGQYRSQPWDPTTGVAIHSPAYLGPGQYDYGLSQTNQLPTWGVSTFKDGGAVGEALRTARASGGGAWTRKEGKNPKGGLNEKGRASLRAQGHDIKRPQPEGGPRKKSFCARMKGMKAKLTSSETANDPDSRINKSLRKWKCADGGEITVDNALRMARGRPDEGGQERFLREQLAGSAPQYEPSQDFPARAERAVQAADRYAGALNDLAAKGAGLPSQFQSPQGRSAREIVESALPQDPNAIVKQAMRQASEGNRLAAAETMLGGIPETGAIRAYHGSPYLFDRFDISKIGTGEGAQAYGHGLYFAESEPVARSYRDDLSSFKRTYKGVPIEDVQLTNDPHVNMILNRMKENPFDDQVSAADAVYNAGIRGKGPYVDWEELRSARDALGKDISRRTSGHMYEVEIAAEPHQLLDWDKPLREQPNIEKRIIDAMGGLKPLRKAVSEYNKKYFSMPIEGNVWDQPGVTFHTLLGDQKVAEPRLKKAGIPGIQYLDAGSRGAGEGSRNFVIFDPSLIDIKRRYADGGEVWDKPRPKSLGNPDPLTSKEKSKAKRMAKAAGRPWPNLIDNMRAAKGK